MKRRREIEAFGMSFLDTISCGFGAIILLLVLTKVFEPIILENTTEELDGLIASLQVQLAEIRGEVLIFNRDLTGKKEQLALERTKLARLQGDISELRGEFAASKQESDLANIIEGQLADASQSLTEEMRRLLENYRPPVDEATVGGIPVDSEYIIFIIDTSGSMYNYAWPAVVKKLQEVLNVYPKVKGIQVMNDMGQYMFTRYQNRWIPDSPARRRAIVDRLRTWNAFSNSSPVEGITKAISSFYAPDKKISLYVFGDEFTGRSIDEVLGTIRVMNRADEKGERRVRIHAIGFPVLFIRPDNLQRTGIRFATLMRLVCEENGGTFVGLNTFQL